MLKKIVEDNLLDFFSNIYVTFQISLSIPVTNCESKRSFYVPSIIKNKYCSMISESILSIIFIQCDIATAFRLKKVTKKCTKENS